MKLTNDNYYSSKANQQYLSVSQYKDFFGSLGKVGCESRALARLNGEYAQEPSTALLTGSYVDSHIEGTLDKFKADHPELFKKDGTLKAEYIQAENAIERIERDSKFMQYLSGDKQVIMTAELFGALWKIKMDSYLKDKAIVDFKYIKDIYEHFYVKGWGTLNFIQYWGYDFQLAIYQKIVELNTGKQLPCYIAVVDKGKVPNIELIQITQPELDSSLLGTQIGVERIVKLKSGEQTPERCKHCDYCKQTKVITTPVLMSTLLEI